MKRFIICALALGLASVQLSAQLLETSQLTLVLSDSFDSPLLYSRAKVDATFEQVGEFAVNEYYDVDNFL